MFPTGHLIEKHSHVRATIYLLNAEELILEVRKAP
jgi:hypothetical protein